MFFEFGETSDMDTNAHVLTQPVFLCEFAKKRCKRLYFVEFGRASDIDTNAHMLEMRFRQLLMMMMMMHVLWIKMTATSAHRYVSS